MPARRSADPRGHARRVPAAAIDDCRLPILSCNQKCAAWGGKQTAVGPEPTPKRPNIPTANIRLVLSVKE